MEAKEEDLQRWDPEISRTLGEKEVIRVLEKGPEKYYGIIGMTDPTNDVHKFKLLFKLRTSNQSYACSLQSGDSLCVYSDAVWPGPRTRLLV